jgi:pimeloyl-ACP methyl ester carboxylesterase
VARRLTLLLLIVVVVIIVARHGFRPPPAPSAFAFGHGSEIVLVHGLGSDIQQWLPTARILARHHRVILVELPGHDLAPMPDPFSLGQAAAALDRSIRQVTNGPVILVGHSLGGLVAAEEALEHPELVRGLVLVETALKPQLPPGPRDQLLARLDQDYDGVLRESYMSFGRDSAQGRQLYAEAARLDPATVKPWIRLAMFADLSSQMRKLQPLMLAVLASHSWEPKETWAQVSRALGYDQVPRVKPVRLDGCGHFVMLDRPDALARIIEQFASQPEVEPVAATP